MLEKYRDDDRESEMNSEGVRSEPGMTHRESVYEDGGCGDFETATGAVVDDANILANTPLLLLTLPLLVVEEPLALVVSGGGCKTPLGLSCISDKKTELISDSANKKRGAFSFSKVITY